VVWERECSNWNTVIESPDNAKRKSILECDVNAYELIAKYLKHGNRSTENGDDTSKMEQYCRSIRTDAASDDDVLDDDLSDDLSDNALENSSVGESGIVGARSLETRVQNKVSFRSKTDANSRTQGTRNIKTTPVQSSRVSCVDKLQISSSTTSTRTGGVTLGGQTIRIFNEPQPPSLEEDNSNVNSDVTTGSEFCRYNGISSGGPQNNKVDTGTSRQQDRFTSSSSLIPRLSSPRRPPRKSKTSSESSSSCSRKIDVIQEYEGSENESRDASNTGCAVPSLSQAKEGNPPTTSEGGCVIKSILKKPSASSPGDISSSLKTFGDTISKPDSTVPGSAVVSALSSQRQAPSPEAASSGSSEFYLPTFQEFKQQHRKKKQVQFKVANDVTLLQPPEEDTYVDPRVITPDTTTPVRNLVATTTTPDLLPVAEDKIGAELSAKLSSDKVDNRNRVEKLGTGSVKQERRDKDVKSVKDEEKRLDLKEEKASEVVKDGSTSSSVREEVKDLNSDGVKNCDEKEEKDIGSVEDVKVLQCFGEGGGDVVSGGDVSCAETASQSGEGEPECAGDVSSSPGDATGDSRGISDSSAATSGE
jgi:hypothetical protein